MAGPGHLPIDVYCWKTNKAVGKTFRKNSISMLEKHPIEANAYSVIGSDKNLYSTLGPLGRPSSIAAISFATVPRKNS